MQKHSYKYTIFYAAIALAIYNINNIVAAANKSQGFIASHMVIMAFLNILFPALLADAIRKKDKYAIIPATLVTAGVIAVNIYLFITYYLPFLQDRLY